MEKDSACYSFSRQHSKSLQSEDIEQIESILEIREKEADKAHMQQYINLLYNWYKEQIK